MVEQIVKVQPSYSKATTRQCLRYHVIVAVGDQDGTYELGEEIKTGDSLAIQAVNDGKALDTRINLVRGNWLLGKIHTAPFTAVGKYRRHEVVLNPAPYVYGISAPLLITKMLTLVAIKDCMVL